MGVVSISLVGTYSQAEVCGCGETQGYRELELWKNSQVIQPVFDAQGRILAITKISRGHLDTAHTPHKTPKTHFSFFLENHQVGKAQPCRSCATQKTRPNFMVQARENVDDKWTDRV
jgi:hypothetical protein